MKPAEVNEIQQNIRNLQQKIVKQERRLSQHWAQIPLKISDHAKVRYLSRVKGIDVDQDCLQLLTPQLMHLYKTLGDGTYPVREDGLKVVIKNGVILTVII